MDFWFQSAAEFFHMGGHAIYVWSAYLITFVLMALNIGVPWMLYRAQKQRLARQLRREHTFAASTTTPVSPSAEALRSSQSH
ncbi:heme exporter protein CcmD [Marinospirillum sp. MEB164]|uniref:Heme exporter protein D n=1 Tax=Marinospirillum alkalitolerans TaxID=3123374 RepID=A0ABW8PV63_9GAMM